MYNLQEIKNKVANKIPVSNDEYLFLIANDNSAFWAFLISNNAGNINNTLRHQLGYIELGFEPSPKALARIIETLLIKGEKAELEKVMQNFVLDTRGLDSEFVQKFTNHFSK